MTADSANDESAGKLVKYLLEKGLGGFPPLSSAANLADEYLIDRDFDSNDERVSALEVLRALSKMAINSNGVLCCHLLA